MKVNLIFSCEHYTNHIPGIYKKYFSRDRDVLNTHRGWDIGIPLIVGRMEREFGIQSFNAENSRLLVDLNRSENHKNLFSSFTKNLPEDEKKRILDLYYFPYRNLVEKQIQLSIQEYNLTVHIAFHSFTPELNGQIRKNSHSILYDPSHKIEAEFASIWKTEWRKISNPRSFRMNYPYLGKADSFPTYLRKKYKDKYVGIEWEFNQIAFSKSGKSLIDRALLDNSIKTFQNVWNRYSINRKD